MDQEVMEPGLANFFAFMRRKGLATTNQRRAIAAAFFALSGHHTREEFYLHVRQVDPCIGQTSVYRTLKLLCEAGLAVKVDFGDNVARYEVARPEKHHDHLVCLECGKIVEICDPRIEELQRELAEREGFSLKGHLHNLYGVCADCATRQS